MITSWIFTLGNFILTTVLTPLTNQTDVVLPANLVTSITNVQGFYSTVNPIFPISTLLACIGIILTIEIAIFAYKVIMWLIKKIPMIS